VRAVEVVRHQLSLAVRVDDHFSGEPWPDDLEVELDTHEPALSVRGGGKIRHSDGTYRFIKLTPGAKQLTVKAQDGTAFTWTPTTPVNLPLISPSTPVVIEMWPSPKARIAAGNIVIRGRLVSAAAGQEVNIEVVGRPPRNRRTRCDANGEFAFVVVGPMELNADYELELEVTVPTRTVDTIQILDGDTNPIVSGSQFAVPPGRETRALINLI
jgi:hypothetical protein